MLGIRAIPKRNLEEGANVVGITSATLLNWMKDPEFDAAYRKARRDAFGQSIARLQQADATGNIVETLCIAGAKPAAGDAQGRAR